MAELLKHIPDGRYFERIHPSGPSRRVSHMAQSYPEAAIHELIQEAYLAGSDASRWPQFLETYRRITDAGNAILIFIDRTNGGTDVSAFAGYSPDAIRLFPTYAHLDPFSNGRAALEPLVPGFIGLAQDLISDEELEQTEYYKQFGREHGAIGGLICVLYAEGPLAACLGANRRAGRHFGQAEVDLTRTLLPHLRTALQIHRQIAQKAQQGLAAISTIDRMPSAIFVCDAECNVLHMNARGRAQAGDWTLNGRLSVKDRDEFDQLRNAVALAVGGDVERAGREQVVRATSHQGVACSALVTPVYQEEIMPMTRPMAAVILHTPNTVSATQLEQLATLFGLTPAESKLAAALLSGASPREASKSLGLSYETVRTYLKRLIHKAGARRQADLIRILLTSMAPF